MVQIKRASPMTLMIISVLGIAGSIALLTLTAAAANPLAHLVVAAVMNTLIAVKCLSEQRRTAGKPSMIASLGYRYMGVAWAWAALVLLVTYVFILQWREWPHYFLACIVLTGVCFFVASALQKDAEGSGADETMAKVARTLALVILIAMLLVAGGLLLHTGKTFQLGGKMAALAGAATQRPGAQEWAGNNIFFCGAISIAVLAWTAYSALRR